MSEPVSNQPPMSGFDEAYRQAYLIASQKLLDTPDLVLLCRRSLAALHDVDGQQTILLPYLGQESRITLPKVIVSSATGETLSPRDTLLVLHYLTTATGSPLTGKPVTFRELPDGSIYYPTFVKRCIKPLLNRFADKPESLIAAAEQMGGVKAETGDFSFKLSVLPRVPLTFSMWLGDEELPTEGNILFDSSVTGYLSTEDITVICEIIAWKLIKPS